MGLLRLGIDALTYVLPAIVLALTVHEYAHGRMAYAFGDPTAKNAGRLSLNPLKHLDPIGFLMLMAMGLGWAKPVPVNSYYFQGDRRKKIMWVSAAGPLSNLAQALLVSVLLSLLLRYAPLTANAFSTWLINFLVFFVHINITLAVFNLIPVPPLDGSKILAGLLPERHMNIIFQLERYGFIILIVLMLVGWLDPIIIRPANAIFNGLMSLVGLS